MSYPAQLLITRSWYLSGIVSRNLQVATGDQINDGLVLLNALLDFKQIETELIPYFTYNQTYTTVPQQETYFIQNCAIIQSVTFNLQSVRYAMDYVPQRIYFGSGRIDNVFTLPFNWTYVRELGGGNLYLYFKPDTNYPLNIFGKFFLTDVALNTDLTTVYDTSYIEYLRYELARYMCDEYGLTFHPQKMAKLDSYRRKLMYLSPPDLSAKKGSILTEGVTINFGDVNLGLGYRPS